MQTSPSHGAVCVLLSFGYYIYQYGKITSMELTFAIEQKQTLKLSAAQLQTIEILQLSALELEQKVQAELNENPVLEIDENAMDSETLRTEIYRESFDSSDRSSDEEGAAAYEKFYVREDTLVDHLMKQLHAISCPDNVRRACRFVIYSLDNNGFLSMSPEDLEAESENTAEEFRQAIPIVQSMDPSGVAAGDVTECLKLQLDPSGESYEDACKVIDMLPELASGNVRKVTRETGIAADRLKSLLPLIQSLDPKPGARFSSGESLKHVAPDVTAQLENGELLIRVAGRIPQLILNPYYLEMARNSADKDVSKYLKERIDSAGLLIRGIEQRNDTIINVTRVILTRQSRFLQNGEHTLEPLTMQEVADEIGVNVSTVSRAVSGKYLKCPAGTYALKYFFTGEVAGGTRDSILKRIRSLIDGEDPAKPLSDQKIAEMLSSEGIEISRRTVAKYRDEAGILPTSARRKRI